MVIFLEIGKPCDDFPDAMKNKNTIPTVFAARTPALGVGVYDDRKSFEREVRDHFGCYACTSEMKAAKELAKSMGLPAAVASKSAAYALATEQIKASETTELDIYKCSKQELQFIEKSNGISQEKRLMILGLLGINELKVGELGFGRVFRQSGTWFSDAIDATSKKDTYDMQGVQKGMDKASKTARRTTIHNDEQIFARYEVGDGVTSIVVDESSKKKYTIESISAKLESGATSIQLRVNGAPVMDPIFVCADDYSKLIGLNEGVCLVYQRRVKVEKGDKVEFSILESSASGLEVECVKTIEPKIVEG